MSSANALASLFGGAPPTKAQMTQTSQKVTFTYKDDSTRVFTDVSKDEVSILSMFSLIDDTVKKIDIEVVFDRPEA